MTPHGTFGLEEFQDTKGIILQKP